MSLQNFAGEARIYPGAAGHRINVTPASIGLWGVRESHPLGKYRVAPMPGPGLHGEEELMAEMRRHGQTVLPHGPEKR